MTAITDTDRTKIAFSTPIINNSDSIIGDKNGPDEALNFEYLRNVLLEFLEKPAMRVGLCRFSSVASIADDDRIDSHNCWE